MKPNNNVKNDNNVKNENNDVADSSSSSSSAATPTIEMVRAYFDLRGYIEEFADKFFHYYNSLDWINTKGKAIGTIWKNSAEQWFEYKSAIEFKKEDEMDAYEKQEAHRKKLKEDARRWG